MGAYMRGAYTWSNTGIKERWAYLRRGLYSGGGGGGGL